MRTLAIFISTLALAAIVAGGLLYLGGRLEGPILKNLLLVTTVIWFVVTPAWMDRK